MARVPMPGRTFTRRNCLYLTGLAATGVVATACGGGDDALPGQTPRAVTPGAENTPGTGPAAQPTAAGQATAGVVQPAAGGQQTPGAAPTSFKEAPQLAEQAKNGQLPAVAERLPKKPLVVRPVERVGKYGGTWRTTILGPADSVWLSRTVGWENLLRWDTEWQQVIPNFAESIQKNPDGSEYTFKLREGLKWSDGAPVTADDALFWWEDVVLNKELSPGGIPLSMKAGDKAGTVEKIDQFTFVAKFPQPNGLFMVNHAQGNGIVLYPKHYLQQFHKKYNTTNLDQLVQQNNAETWVKLFQTKGTAIPASPTTRPGTTRSCRPSTPGGSSRASPTPPASSSSATPSTSRSTRRGPSSPTSTASPSTSSRTAR